MPEPTDGNTRDIELTEPILRALEYVMLAQAQECAWQLAVMGGFVFLVVNFFAHCCQTVEQYKNAAIAKLSSGVRSRVITELVEAN